MNVDTPPADSQKLISIVAPAFNEEAGLAEFVRRIDATMETCGHNYEIVFVNDGSTDGTRAVMGSLRAACSNITIVNLTRNFGKEVAMTAGIAHAAGDAVVIIDTDLQDPPEVIPELIGEWRNGYDNSPRHRSCASRKLCRPPVLACASGPEACLFGSRSAGSSKPEKLQVRPLGTSGRYKPKIWVRVREVEVPGSQEERGRTRPWLELSDEPFQRLPRVRHRCFSATTVVTSDASPASAS